MDETKKKPEDGAEETSDETGSDDCDE